MSTLYQKSKPSRILKTLQYRTVLFASSTLALADLLFPCLALFNGRCGRDRAPSVLRSNGLDSAESEARSETGEVLPCRSPVPIPIRRCWRRATIVVPRGNKSGEFVDQSSPATRGATRCSSKLLVVASISLPESSMPRVSIFTGAVGVRRHAIDGTYACGRYSRSRG